MAEIPGQSEYLPEELDEFIDLRGQLLEFGFTGCDVRLPTKGWHGVRIEAYVELDIDDPLPYIRQGPGQDRLIAWTLSGIGYDVGLGVANSLPSRLAFPSGNEQLLPEIQVDQDIKERMLRIAKLGRELAYMGLGFPDEYPWIKPIEVVSEPIVLCADNATRRFKEAVIEATNERHAYWEKLGWIYSIDWPISEDVKPGIALLRFTDYNSDEDSLDNRILSVRCDEQLTVTAVQTPDWGPTCPIDPVGPLTLEELAELQSHTRAEFETGSLSPRYLEQVLGDAKL